MAPLLRVFLVASCASTSIGAWAQEEPAIDGEPPAEAVEENAGKPPSPELPAEEPEVPSEVVREPDRRDVTSGSALAEVLSPEVETDWIALAAVSGAATTAAVAVALLPLSVAVAQLVLPPGTLPADFPTYSGLLVVPPAMVLFPLAVGLAATAAAWWRLPGWKRPLLAGLAAACGGMALAALAVVGVEALLFTAPDVLFSPTLADGRYSLVGIVALYGATSMLGAGLGGALGVALFPDHWE